MLIEDWKTRLNHYPSNEQGEPSWEKVERFAVYGKGIWYFGDKNMLIRKNWRQEAMAGCLGKGLDRTRQQSNIMCRIAIL